MDIFFLQSVPFHIRLWVGVGWGVCVSRLLFTGSIPLFNTNLWFQIIWSWHLVKQITWRDGCRRKRGGCQQLSQRKGACLQLNKKEAKWIDPSEFWWREERWTNRESLWLPVIGTWRYPILTARPHSNISTILRPPLGSWNLVNYLLRMNEAWMDECTARLQPLVDQYKPKEHQPFAIEKFRDLILTTWSCPGTKKISLKKKDYLKVLQLKVEEMLKPRLAWISLQSKGKNVFTAYKKQTIFDTTLMD